MAVSKRISRRVENFLLEETSRLEDKAVGAASSLQVA
jgi:hypothetical protein